jgi:hypothetical protein
MRYILVNCVTKCHLVKHHLIRIIMIIVNDGLIASGL